MLAKINKVQSDMIAILDITEIIKSDLFQHKAEVSGYR